MGVDTCIYVRTRDGKEPELVDSLPNECSVREVREWSVENATHEIEQCWRYYGPGYERGPWPRIAAVLMALFASPNVEHVWYFGDCSDEGEPITPEQVMEICAHYMRVGDRPYRTAFAGVWPSQAASGSVVEARSNEQGSPHESI